MSDENKNIPDEEPETKNFTDILRESDSRSVSVDNPEIVKRLSALTEIFENEFNDEFEEITLTTEEAENVRKYLTRLRRGGMSAIGLLCAGDNCDYRHACPLWLTKDGAPQQVPDPDSPGCHIMVQMTKAPVGRPCPIEASVVADTYVQYISHSIIDPSNPVHNAYIHELCQLASREWRINMLLAFDHHGMTQKVPAAVSPTGEVYTKQEKNVLLDGLQQISDRRSRILKELTISPEAEYKRRLAEGDDSESISRKAAARRERLREIEQGSRNLQVPEHVKGDAAFFEPTNTEKEDERESSEESPEEEAL